MGPETLDYAKSLPPGSRWIHLLYKHSYAFAGAMMVFVNLFPGGTRGSTLGSGYTSEFGWPLAHRREIYFVKGLMIDDHKWTLPVDAGAVILLTVLFALVSRAYLRHVQLGKPTAFFLAAPIAQGLFAMYLVLVCLSHLLFNLGN